MSIHFSLGERAHRILLQELGRTRSSDERARIVMRVFGIFLVEMSAVVGESGSLALFRQSLRRTKATFPCFTEVLAVESPDFMEALRVCLEKENPECIAEASIALLTSFVELLATFIGERLTRTLLHQVWPDTGPSQPQEIQQ